jgi:hypothetical protein
MTWIDEHEEVAIEHYRFMRSLKMSLTDMYAAIGEPMPDEDEGGDGLIVAMARAHDCLPVCD